MKKAKENKEKLWLPVDSLLVCLAAIVVLITGMTASNYTTTSEAQDAAQVAVFKVTENITGAAGAGQQAVLNLSGIAPGVSKTFEFVIENESDVAVNCLVKLVTTENLPVTYTISAGGASKTMNSGENVEMPSFRPHADPVTYTITATWQTGKNELKYADMTDAVKVYVTTDQID